MLLRFLIFKSIAALKKTRYLTAYNRLLKNKNYSCAPIATTLRIQITIGLYYWLIDNKEEDCQLFWCVEKYYNNCTSIRAVQTIKCKYLSCFVGSSLLATWCGSCTQRFLVRHHTQLTKLNFHRPIPAGACFWVKEGWHFLKRSSEVKSLCR